MTFADNYSLATTESFQNRVLVGLTKAMLDVAAEAPTENPTKDEKRKELSKLVLNNLQEYVFEFSVAVTTNPVINLNSPDDAIQFTINSVIDAFAGA